MKSNNPLAKPVQEPTENENTKWDDTLKTWIYKNPKAGDVYMWDFETQAFVAKVDEDEIESKIHNYYVSKVPEDIHVPVIESENVPGTTGSLINLALQDRYIKDKGATEIIKKEDGSTYIKKKVNRSLYVSGLPEDVTIEECITFFSKAGLIKKADNGDPMIKLYKNENGKYKGDGLVTYLRPESISQAFILIKDCEIRPNYPVAMEEALFKVEGPVKSKKRAKKRKVHIDQDGNAVLDPSTVVIPQAKKKRGFNQNVELSWGENEQKHIILKKIFKPEDARDDVFFYDQLKEEILEEAEKFGKVESVKVFEGNPNGVVAIKFAHGKDAEECLKKMNGRSFDGVKIEAEFYDGYSNYKVEEKDQDIKKRDQNWCEWLEKDEKET